MGLRAFHYMTSLSNYRSQGWKACVGYPAELIEWRASVPRGHAERTAWQLPAEKAADCRHVSKAASNGLILLLWNELFIPTDSGEQSYPQTEQREMTAFNKPACTSSLLTPSSHPKGLRLSFLVISMPYRQFAIPLPPLIGIDKCLLLWQDHGQSCKNWAWYSLSLKETDLVIRFSDFSGDKQGMK